MLLPELRTYQEESSLNTRRKLKDKKRVILSGPCGSGKTITGTDLVIRACKKGLTAIFLCDREELLEQTAKTFLSHKVDFQVINRSTQEVLKTQCYIGMVETFYRRVSAGWQFNIDLIICDEAHIGNYFKVINLFPNVMVIGLTATPVSSAVNHPLNKFYQDIVISSTVPELVKQGYLVPAIEMGHNRLLEFKVQNGEFSNESQADQWKSHKIDEKMFLAWNKYCNSRQTIVYCINIEHAEKVCKLFQDKGISAMVVHSKVTKDERRRILNAYRAKFCQVLVNVGVYTKGFDSPQTSCIVLDRATSSMTLFYQMGSRGGRPHPGKKDFILLDMGNNILRFGSLNEDINWKDLFINEERDKRFTIKTNIRLCPVCYSYQHNKFINSCPTCGNNFKVNKMISPESVIPDTLRKPLHEMTFAELKTYGKLKGYKGQWAFLQRFGNVANKRYR